MEKPADKEQCIELLYDLLSKRFAGQSGIIYAFSIGSLGKRPKFFRQFEKRHNCFGRFSSFSDNFGKKIGKLSKTSRFFFKKKFQIFFQPTQKILRLSSCNVALMYVHIMQI